MVVFFCSVSLIFKIFLRVVMGNPYKLFAAL